MRTHAHTHTHTRELTEVDAEAVGVLHQRGRQVHVWRHVHVC